jgi:hypothetical protein
MNTLHDHFETFRRLFPASRIVVLEDAMHYRFRNQVTARYFEQLAQEIIIANKLPLVAALGIWSAGGVVFEMSMEVKAVPEEYFISR